MWTFSNNSCSLASLGIAIRAGSVVLNQPKLAFSAYTCMVCSHVPVNAYLVSWMEVQMLEKQIFNMCFLRREFRHCQEFFYVRATGKKEWVVKPNISWKCKYLGWSFLGRPFRAAERINGKVQFRDLCCPWPSDSAEVGETCVHCSVLSDDRFKSMQSFFSNSVRAVSWKQMFYPADSCHFIDLFHLNWETLILLWDLHAEENSEGERDRD